MKQQETNLYKVNFSIRIKEARVRTGFSQKEVSEATGIIISAISKYENGLLEPDLEKLGKLAEFYGVSVDWLLGIGMQPGSRPNYDTLEPKNTKKIMA